MKNITGYKAVKIGSLVFLALFLGWYFLWGPFFLLNRAESPLKYEAIIKGEKEIFNYGCNSEDLDSVEGLWCNDYPELANLDGNPEYSDTEKMITRSIQVYNTRISCLTSFSSDSFWEVVLLALLIGVNLVMDLRYKK